VLRVRFPAKREARPRADTGNASGIADRLGHEVADAERDGFLLQMNFDSHPSVTIQ
jgi:hypothetical protein